MKKPGDIAIGQKFLVFLGHNKYDELFEWNEREGAYLDKDGKGFMSNVIETYPKQFITFQSVEEHAQWLAYFKHEKEHGPEKKDHYDFKCPDCGWQYEFKNKEIESCYHEESLFLQTPDDGDTNMVRCLCGLRLKAIANVSVDYSVMVFSNE